MAASPEEIREMIDAVRLAVRLTPFDEGHLASARAQLDQLIMAFRAEGVSDLFTGVACLLALQQNGMPMELGMVVLAAMEGIR